MSPIVSIITPYRNAAKFLPRFVASIQAQTLNDWVCIMVNDGSTDNGPHELREMVSHDSRFRLLNNTTPKLCPGPASARNCALASVSTRLVAFCDVDDLWHPEKLEKQLSFHLTQNLDLSVSAYARFCNERLDDPLRFFSCPPSQLCLPNFYGRNPIPMLTVILSANLARRGFQQVAHEDFLFWLELFRLNPAIRYGCVPLVLAFYCVHSENTSGKKTLMPIWTYRVFRRNGHSKLGSIRLLLLWSKDHIVARLKAALPSKYESHSLSRYLKEAPHII